MIFVARSPTNIIDLLSGYIPEFFYIKVIIRELLLVKAIKDFIGHPLSQIRNLCVGCGACEGVCLQNAIEFKLDLRDYIYKPVVDFDRCTLCMKCVKVCPSINNEFIKPIYRSMLGRHIKFFTGFSKNHNIRKNGASGGIITALLLFMLDRKLVDDVIISKMNRKGRTKSFITNSKETILSAQGSIYFQTFTGKLIKEVLRRNDKRYAIVGLPCQIEAFRRAENLFPSFPAKKCVYLGLMCNHINVFWYLGYLVKHYFKENYEDVVEISHRKGAWPGGITLKTAHKSIHISLDEFWRGFPSLNFCSPLGCLFCADHTNVLADISVGDAWLPEVMKKDKIGTSIIIARSRRGLEVLRKAQKENAIELTEISIKKVLKSQPIKEKRLRASICRLTLRQSIISAIRIYGFRRTLLCLLPLLHSLASRNLFIRRLVVNSPRNLVIKYELLYKALGRGIF